MYIQDNLDQWDKYDREHIEDEERKDKLSNIMDKIENVVLLLDEDGTNEQAQDELREILDRLEEMI